MLSARRNELYRETTRCVDGILPACHQVAGFLVGIFDGYIDILGIEGIERYVFIIDLHVAVVVYNNLERYVLVVIPCARHVIVLYDELTGFCLVVQLAAIFKAERLVQCGYIAVRHVFAPDIDGVSYYVHLVVNSARTP